MIAFHGNETLKNNLLAEVEKHRIADQIISGTYGSERDGKWKGCAVGCSIRSYNLLHGTEADTSAHSQYPALFGIPQILARLEDRIFEGLPANMKAAWPGQFFNAIKPGADLSQVWPQFAVWLLVDVEHGVIRHAASNKVKSAIERVAELYRTNGTKQQFLEARKEARSTDSADASADADTAAYAYAAAAYAAAAYADAAYAAAAADAAAAAYAAAAYARKNAFKHQSIKLLELMASAK